MKSYLCCQQIFIFTSFILGSRHDQKQLHEISTKLTLVIPMRKYNNFMVEIEKFTIQSLLSPVTSVEHKNLVSDKNLITSLREVEEGKSFETKSIINESLHSIEAYDSISQCDSSNLDITVFSSVEYFDTLVEEGSSDESFVVIEAGDSLTQYEPLSLNRKANSTTEYLDGLKQGDDIMFEIIKDRRELNSNPRNQKLTLSKDEMVKLTYEPVIIKKNLNIEDAAQQSALSQYQTSYEFLDYDNLYANSQVEPETPALLYNQSDLTEICQSFGLESELDEFIAIASKIQFSSSSLVVAQNMLKPKNSIFCKEKKTVDKSTTDDYC